MPSAQPTTGPVLSPNNGRQRQYNKFCGGHKKRETSWFLFWCPVVCRRLSRQRDLCCRRTTGGNDSTTSSVEGTKKEDLLVFFQCPEQDLNLHIFRYTHLKRARLPIPPSGRRFAFFFVSGLCPGQDLNLHRLWRLPPQSSVSTNSPTWAILSSRDFSLR